jgi:adenylate cyclase
VRWAVQMQQGVIDRNTDVADDDSIRFRVGIGDVIVDDKDLYGDAVNIAARLENLAEPGGICISRPVRDKIRDLLALPFEDSGEQSFRNIARPIRVYVLSAEAIAALPKTEAPEAPQQTARHNARRGYVIGQCRGIVMASARLSDGKISPLLFKNMHICLKPEAVLAG